MKRKGNISQRNMKRKKEVKARKSEEKAREKAMRQQQNTKDHQQDEVPKVSLRIKHATLYCNY